MPCGIAEAAARNAAHCNFAGSETDADRSSIPNIANTCMEPHPLHHHTSRLMQEPDHLRILTKCLSRGPGPARDDEEEGFVNKAADLPQVCHTVTARDVSACCSCCNMLRRVVPPAVTSMQRSTRFDCTCGANSSLDCQIRSAASRILFKLLRYPLIQGSSA